MDDQRLFMSSIKYGWRWHQGKLIFRKCWEEEELKEGISKEMKTSLVMLDIQNSVFSCLNFEMETPQMFSDNKLPTLDFKCFVLDKKIQYSFYQKPMAKKTVIQRKSALGENCKIASLSQNLVRRMKNTSEDLPDSERIQIIDEYSSQLSASGYSAAQSRRIVTAGLTGYQGLVERVAKGETVMHRSAAEGFASRKRKKLLGPGNWFKTKRKFENKKQKRKKEKKEEPEVITVLFVPQTPGGELSKRLQRAEEKISKLTGEKVRMVEKAGRTVRQMLHKSNHWSGGVCGRDKCLPCHSGDGTQDCRDKNIVYDIVCSNCEANKQTTVYTGMTSRTAFERGREHLNKLSACAQDSAFYKHTEDFHLGVEVKFKMKTVQKHFSALNRTLHEAVRIRKQSANPSVI